MIKSMNRKSYLTLALTAALAATIGWGASALSLNRSSDAQIQPAAVAPAANQLTPVAPLSESLAPVVVAPAPQPVAQQRSSTQRRPRLITRSQTGQASADTEAAPEVETTQPAEPASRTLPVRTRNDEPKSGMSNTLKTVLAIGGGAATGAAVGGLAGGKKGAAIGALAGGGGGAIYSIIRKKQGKEVW
jgi:hypothetical protein